MTKHLKIKGQFAEVRTNDNQRELVIHTGTFRRPKNFIVFELRNKDFNLLPDLFISNEVEVHFVIVEGRTNKKDKGFNNNTLLAKKVIKLNTINRDNI